MQCDYFRNRIDKIRFYAIVCGSSRRFKNKLIISHVVAIWINFTIFSLYKLWLFKFIIRIQKANYVLNIHRDRSNRTSIFNVTEIFHSMLYLYQIELSMINVPVIFLTEAKIGRPSLKINKTPFKRAVNMRAPKALLPSENRQKRTVFLTAFPADFSKRKRRWCDQEKPARACFRSLIPGPGKCLRLDRILMSLFAATT